MWNYRHSVKENPMSLYIQCTTNRQPGSGRPHFVCVNEKLRMSRTLCSVRKTIQKRTDWIVRSHVKLAFTDWLHTK